jgi:hypothetical protein
MNKKRQIPLSDIEFSVDSYLKENINYKVQLMKGVKDEEVTIIFYTENR